MASPLLVLLAAISGSIVTGFFALGHRWFDSWKEKKRIVNEAVYFATQAYANSGLLRAQLEQLQDIISLDIPESDKQRLFVEGLKSINPYEISTEYTKLKYRLASFDPILATKLFSTSINDTSLADFISRCERIYLSDLEASTSQERTKAILLTVSTDLRGMIGDYKNLTFLLKALLPEIARHSNYKTRRGVRDFINRIIVAEQMLSDMSKSSQDTNKVVERRIIRWVTTRKKSASNNGGSEQGA